MIDKKMHPINEQQPDLLLIYGTGKNIKDKVFEANSAIKNGYRYADYRDVVAGSLTKNNGDNFILNRFYFVLFGNPIIGSPMLDGEHIIINNLEDKLFEPLKDEMKKPGFFRPNNYDSFNLGPKNQDLYETFKNEGRGNVTLVTADDMKIFRRSRGLGNVNKREEIIRNLLLGNDDLFRQYKDSAAAHMHTMDVEDKKGKVMEQLFAYYPQFFDGVRFLTATTANMQKGELNATAYGGHEPLLMANRNSELYGNKTRYK